MNNYPGKGKTILLGMPNWFLFNEIKTSLEELGFRVIDISFSNKFKYANLKDRLISFVNKNIFRNLDYKARLNFRDTSQNIIQTVENIDFQVDFCLLIRPDYYSVEFIEILRNKCKSLIAYQWDGLDRFPWVTDRIHLFDRFFVFDPSDLKMAQVSPATNFYFNYHIENSREQDLSVYYLGLLTRKRMPKVFKLADYLNKIEVNYLFKLITNKDKVIEKFNSASLNVQKSYISYEENISFVNRSKIIVDFLHDVHKGLSFRVFEAIGNDKKLILDNPEILKYEFYDPANFFLVKDDNFNGLEEFINTPYKPLPDHVKQKYSFDNWIRYVLDIEPYQKIELPH